MYYIIVRTERFCPVFLAAQYKIVYIKWKVDVFLLRIKKDYHKIVGIVMQKRIKNIGETAFCSSLSMHILRACAVFYVDWK